MSPNGRIAVGGYGIRNADPPGWGAMAVLKSNGYLDPTFRQNGKHMFTYRTGIPCGVDVVVATNGHIYVAGKMNNGSQGIGLARFRWDGVFDTSFGVMGVALFNQAGYLSLDVTDMARSEDGRLTIVGGAIAITEDRGQSDHRPVGRPLRLTVPPVHRQIGRLTDGIDRHRCL